MVQRIAIVSDGSRYFRSDAMQQQPKSRQVMNLVKKMFFQKNEDVFVISEKLKYMPSRDETKLVVEELQFWKLKLKHQTFNDL